MVGGSWSSGWRAPLRIARREVLRSRGRSVLVATMVGVPVLLTVAGLTLMRTGDVSRIEALPTLMGRADAVVQPVAQHPIRQEPAYLRDPGRFPRQAAAWSAAEVAAVTGGELLPVVEGQSGLRTADGVIAAQVMEVDVTDPVSEGMLAVRSGRLPQTPGEVAVSPWLAEHGFAVGATAVPAAGGDSLSVVGVVTHGTDVDDRLVVALPGAILGGRDAASTRYLLDRASPVSWEQVREWNRKGLGVLSRAVVQDPPKLRRGIRSSDATAERTVQAMIVAAVVLEVVLLAAPAFAVGVRRQRRGLALIGATGAEPRQLRRVVFAQALVLGALSVAACAAAGVGLAWVLARVVAAQGWFGMGPFDVRALDVLAPAAIGVLAALAAAYLPARQAGRTEIVAGLAGRRGTTRTRWGWPVVGTILIGLGAVVTFTAVTGGSEFSVAFGTVFLVVGAVLTVPSLIGAAGRLARVLPLPLRFAVRDAARQRGRTAPAVAAVMASVIGVTALAIGSASDFAERRKYYQPNLPMGTTTVVVSGTGTGGWEQAAAAIEEVTGRDPVTWRAARYRAVSVMMPGCSMMDAVRERQDCWRWQAPPGRIGEGATLGPLVTTPDGVAALGGNLDEEAREVLTSGGVLLVNPRAVGASGTARLVVGPRGDKRVVEVPARASPALYRGEGERMAALAMTPATAQRLGIRAPIRELILPPSDGPLTEEREQQVTEAITAISRYSDVYVERGFQDTYTLPFLALAVAGGLIVLVATVTATGLALADARPDLATMAAVGAAPATRRLLAAGQALTIGGLGAGLGVAIGFVPGVAVAWPLTTNGWPNPSDSPVIDIPWLLLATVGIAVPLLAAASAALFTRSRLPMVRRHEV